MSYSRDRILSLDFDGAVHPGADVVHLSPGKALPIWQVEVAMRSQGRFVWLPFLEEALQDSDVSIVVHSTWRRRFSDSEIKQLIGPALAERVINLDGQMATRLSGTGDEYVREMLDFLRPKTVLVLDDRPEFFAAGAVQEWISENSGEFLWVDPEKGISESSALAKLAQWAHAPMPTEYAHLVAVGVPVA